MYKTQSLVIRELKELFDLENNLEKGSIESDGIFYISKMQMGRLDVLNVLQDYFHGVGVKDGYVSVNPITFVHTTFTICDGVPN